MKILVRILCLILLANAAQAEETISEKASAKTNDVKRTVKAKIHRIDETICEKTDKSCLAKKAENRAAEAKDYVSDKTSEAVNKVDDDKKSDAKTEKNKGVKEKK